MQLQHTLHDVAVCTDNMHNGEDGKSALYLSASFSKLFT